MAVFAAVVEAHSFSGAARQLGLTRSAVSRQVALLEDSLGLTLIPAFYVAADLRAGRLQEVLADHEIKRSAMYAVYPSREHLSHKVRVFVDLLASMAAELVEG